jgi:hypothetical protein
MSLLTVLGLTLPAAARQPAVAALAGSDPAPAEAAPVRAAPGAAPPKGASSKVEHGPAQVKPTRTKMTDLKWGSTTKPLWGFLDRDGRVIQGVASGPLRSMSAANQAAIDIVKSMPYFNGPRWPATLDVVVKARDRSKADLAKLAQLADAVREYTKKNATFFADVNAFIKAKDDAQVQAEAIGAAETRYRQALRMLDAELGEKELEQSKDAAGKAKADLDKAKAELKEKRDLIGSLYDTATKIATADWKGLADKAIAYVTEKALDQLTSDLFGVDIAGLEKKLDEAEAAVKRNKERWLDTKIDVATIGMRAAAQEFKTAREQLQAALRELARQQANGTRVLTSDKAPAAIRLAGEMVVRRVEQQRAIAEARERCRNYLALNAGTVTAARGAQKRYTAVISDLGSAPATEPVYRSGTPWGKEADYVAAANRVAFGDLASWLEGEASKCVKRVDAAKLEEAGRGGPLEYFDAAIEKVHTALSALPATGVK